MKYNWELFFESEEGEYYVDCYDLSTNKEQKLERILKDNEGFLYYFYDIEDMYYTKKELFRYIKEIELELKLELSDDLMSYYDKIVDPLNERLMQRGDKKYSRLAQWTPLLSVFLFAEKQKYAFYPIVFCKEYAEFLRRCSVLGIELPDMPKEKDRRDRCLAYIKLCMALEEFRKSNCLTKPQLCALLYGYAPHISDEIKAKRLHNELPPASKIWIVGGGTHGDGDLEVLEAGKETEWQGGPAAKRGDIMIIYKNGKDGHVNSIWRVVEDFTFNLFDIYCNRVKIGHHIAVPKVTKHDLESDEIAKNMWMVKLSMAYMDGRKEVSYEDYHTFIRLFKKKDPSFDTSILPDLEGFYIDEEFDGKEKDVSIQYLENHLLPELGYSESDWVKELQLRLGRTIKEEDQESKKGRPDFTILHSDLGLDQKVAPFVIEVKLDMKDDDSTTYDEALKQGISYARMLHSRILAICDKRRFHVFKTKTGFFTKDDCIFKHTWEELKDPVLAQELKGIIGKQQITNLISKK